MTCKCNFEESYDVIGLCDKDEISTAPGTEWTELSVPEVLVIPRAKPDVEQVNRVFINAKILSARVIKTPVGTLNAEGTKLTGRKLVVTGELNQTLVYTANERTQSVHTAHFCMPFSAFIVLADLPGGAKADVNDVYCVTPCIEDVFVKVLCDREIFKNVTLFLKAKKIDSMVC